MQLCRENPDMRFEIDAEGKLIIMSPTGSLTGERNADLSKFNPRTTTSCPR